jgi:hypothetical protein
MPPQTTQTSRPVNVESEKERKLREKRSELGHLFCRAFRDKGKCMRYDRGICAYAHEPPSEENEGEEEDERPLDHEVNPVTLQFLKEMGFKDVIIRINPKMHKPCEQN